MCSGVIRDATHLGILLPSIRTEAILFFQSERIKMQPYRRPIFPSLRATPHPPRTPLPPFSSLGHI